MSSKGPSTRTGSRGTGGVTSRGVLLLHQHGYPSPEKREARSIKKKKCEKRGVTQTYIKGKGLPFIGDRLLAKNTVYILLCISYLFIYLIGPPPSRPSTTTTSPSVVETDGLLEHWLAMKSSYIITVIHNNQYPHGGWPTYCHSLSILNFLTFLDV